VIIVNPLGGALQHYTTGLAASIAAAGARVSVEHVPEPSVVGGGGIGWVRRYVRALWAARRLARRSGARVVVTWPVVGHLDRLLLHVLFGPRVRSALVVHDPRPLVRARGYGRLSRWIGNRGRLVEVLAHSRTAVDVLVEACPGLVPVLLPHPIVPRGASARSRTDAGRPVVRVLGQYKPDRDLDLLVGVGLRFRGTHSLEVVGRRWPPIDGWAVTDEFVSEGRLDHLIATADVVIVPYTRFFQSGIAIRSLELGTPAVGPAESSMADLYPDARYLGGASVASWCAAIDAAASAEPDDVLALAADADRRCRAAWAEWLGTAAA